MMMRIVGAVACSLCVTNLFAATNPYQPAACTGTVVPINGVVTSRPPTDLNDNIACLTAAANLGLSPPTAYACLRIDVSGTVKASGYSVLTSVPAVSLVAGTAATPLCFPGDATRGCGDPF